MPEEGAGVQGPPQEGVQLKLGMPELASHL